MASPMVLNLTEPRFFNTIPHVVVTPPTVKLLLLLFHNCNLATVMNHTVNTLGDSVAKGVATHRLSG